MRRLLLGVLVLAVASLGGSLFAQSCPNTAPTTFVPANNATGVTRDASNTVTLKWNAVSGTQQYDVYFGPQGTGCTNLHATVAPSLSPQWSPPANEIVDGAVYEWKVVVKAPVGCPVAQYSSTCLKFQMIACPAAAPVLQSPANNASVAPGAVTLSWNGVANAGFYELFVAIDNGAPSLVATTTANSRTISTEAGHTIHWAVRAAKSGCGAGFLSTSSQFFTTCPTTPAAPATPADNATFNDASAIVFSWGAVEGASSYTLQRSSDNGVNWTSFADNLTGRTFTATFGIGSWKWRVRANFSGNCSPVDSPPRGLTVISSSCTNNPPALVSPPDGASQTLPVTLTWASPTSQGKTFLIFVSGPNGTAQAGTTTNNSFVLTQLDPGTYQWYVVEKNPNCPDVQSARRTLTIKKRECANESINITAPANGATVPSPVTITWTPISNATAYRVWASINGSATVLLANTTGTSASVNVPSGVVKFKVDGLRDDCPSVLSAESSFTVPAASDCANNSAPQLGTPTPKTDPATGRKSVVLPWIAQTRGIYYRVFVALDGQPFENAGDTRGDGSQIEVSLPAGDYRWYVQALFTNCPPVNSPTGAFTVEETAPRCSSDKPVVVEPVNGSTVPKLKFKISEVTPAGRQVRYRFFAVIDRTNAAPEVVFLGASTTPEFEPALQFPPGTYQVFVEKSVDQCPSTFSDRITVTIARSQNCSTAKPQLVSPANGTGNLSPQVDFRWNALPQPGASYVLVAQVNDGTPTPIGVTTDTHLTRRVPPGTIRWRVIATYQGCDALLSDVWGFSVELPKSCELPPPVGLHPSGVEEASELGIPFAWTAVPLAANYHLWAWQDGEEPEEVASTGATRLRVPLDPGAYHWFVVADVPNCGSLQSATGELTVIPAPACGTPDQPQAHVVGRALSGSPYVVRWSSLAHVKTYELQQSTSSDFSNAETFLVNDTEYAATQTISGDSAQYHYRVRGVSDCNDARGPYSDVVTVVIIGARTNNASVEIGGSGDVTQQLFIPGTGTPTTFSITLDKPWMKATPSSGQLPAGGTTVTLTSDRNQLRLGGNTATVKVSVGDTAGEGKLQTHATTVATFPINVSLVTPVTPSGKSGPSPDSLIFGAVGHAPGQNGSFFESDVRVANLSAQPMKYQINYTPSGTDGTVTGNTTTVEIAPNQTLALDDILSTLFGLGDTGGALGMLEVRPLTTATTSSGGLYSTVTSTAQQLLTLGSSRTYNFTPAGTFGQFVPATPFAKFVGSGKVLSLQQVAQSAAFRANFGFLEASGAPVDLTVRVYDTLNHLLGTIPVSLQASEHKQIGLLLASNGITLEDGRVEVEVTGGSGKITSYVSEVDNNTNDPFVASAVEKGSVVANRYIVPGMAHKDLGFAFWVSDLRIYNSGTTPVPATLTFYTEANPSSFVTKSVTIDPGEIEVLNDVVQNLFGQPNGAGGSVVVTTPGNAPLDVTARTYNKTTNGTFGQFIPGVTVAESVGAGQRALQILQIEQSSRFRTYIALTETTGNAARVEVGLVLPDSIATQYVTYDLAGNEYRQISLADFGVEDAIYNGRVTVKVISGSGKITASGSSIDMLTNDPTYITGQ